MLMSALPLETAYLNTTNTAPRSYKKLMSCRRVDGRMVSEDDVNAGCEKCGHTDAEVGTISTTGGGLSKMFDVQTNSFKVVSCTNCGYSELYRYPSAGSSDIVDIFLS